MRRLLALLILLAALPGACWAAEVRVLLVLSDNTSPYQSFARMLGKSVPDSIRLSTQEPPEEGSGTSADLVVAVGLKALESAIARSDVPVLGVMIHKSSYEALIEKTARRRSGTTSAIYLNQPWERQLDFIQAVLPDRRKIGLAHSPGTHLELDGLKESFAARGLALTSQAVRSPDVLFSILDELLAKTDVLLAVPDSEIYNPGSIRNILLTSYRHRTPLIGVSQSYVNAGALGAIFSTPEQLAAQTGVALGQFAKTRRLPSPQYPDLYAIALNYQVGRSLGIDLPSQDEVRERMNKKAREEMQ